jgi:hypothetical protein
MSLLRGTIVKGYAENIPQGKYTLHVTDWKEVAPNAILKKDGYIKLTGTITELKGNLINDCRYEKQLEYFFSELKQVYFADDELTDIEILDALVGQDITLWVTYSPNPTDPTKPYRNLNYREPYTVQAQNLFE